MATSELKDFIATVSGDSQFAIEENLGGGFVRLRVSEAQRRQAKQDIRCVEDACLEMLRNARDAEAHTIYVSLAREGSLRELVFIDDGKGIPRELGEAVFEPRVTSKIDEVVTDKWGVQGRGMALYSIRSNASSANLMASDEGLGCAFKLVFDLEELHEKKDQSTYPVLETTEDGEQSLRGPHNIVRCLVEFALEYRDSITLYLGTPTTIAALLYAKGMEMWADSQRLFATKSDELPVYLRPSVAADASSLMQECAEIGLAIGERTAHRIIAGQIEPAEEPLRRVLGLDTEKKKREADIYADTRGLKVSHEDVDKFSEVLEEAFEYLSQRYYLNLADKPKVRVGKDSITVKFPIEKEL